MGPLELLRWQWESYPRYHTHRVNLILHLVVVPLFLAGSVILLLGVVRLSWTWLLGGAACMAVSVVAQGRGHRLEAVPPEPFTGPGNFVGRLFLEQWINFPRFVLSGRWWQSLRMG